MSPYATRLWQNLELLGFDADHTSGTFLGKSDAKLVDRMIHFLFSKMSPKESPNVLTFVTIMMWVSVWALRKQASLENYAQVKYPASIYEPYACSTAEAREELHEKYLPTQKKVFEKVLGTFQGKRVKFEAIISAVEQNETRTESIEALGQDIESNASNLLQQLEAKAGALEKLDRRDDLHLQLRNEEAQLQKAKSENERLKAELRMYTAEIFGLGKLQKKEPQQAQAVDSFKKKHLVAALLSNDLLKTGKSTQESVHNPSILGSDLDADFLVR